MLRVGVPAPYSGGFSEEKRSMALESQSGAVAQPAARRLSGGQQAILVLSRIWGWVFLAVLIILFTVLSAALEGINFLSLRNSQNILVAIIPILLMGLGETFVIIAGGIDLSVGWVMGLSSVVAALIMRDLVAFNTTTSAPLVLIAGFAGAIGVALVVGLVNGVVIAKLRVPPFIVTLGTSFIARGFGYLLSGANVVGGQPTFVRDFGNEALMYWMPGSGLSIFQRPEVAQEQLRVLEKIFPWPVVVTAIVTAIAIFLLHKTQYGRHTFAIGGNREAAIRAGVPVDRHTIMLYVLSGLTTGVAGFLHTCRYSGGSAIAGETLLLSAIAAVVIGGVSMFGGEGRVTGTIVGALILAVLQTGLVMLNVQPYWQYVVIGIIVILAVLIDQSRDLIVGRAEASGGGS